MKQLSLKYAGILLLAVMSMGYVGKHVVPTKVVTTWRIPQTSITKLKNIDCPQQPMNLSHARRAVEKYYDSGCVDKELSEVIEQAIAHFEQNPADPDEKSVVVFDIDDTLLTFYYKMKEIQFGYIAGLFKKWIQAADVPALQEVKRLYNYLVQHNFLIVLLSGRSMQDYDATVKNLNNQGITKLEKVILRKPEDDTMTDLEYKKKERAKLVKEGYTIVGCIGDQESDLEGGNAGYTVKIPNYTYTLA